MEPIFILACSPRSGSTFLQRVFTSTGDVLIWGESHVLFPFGDLWTPDKESNPNNPHDLHMFRKKKADMWMAVLNPLMSNLMVSHKRYLESLYGLSALQEGYKRWGKKDTLWGGGTLRFLTYAWPSCRMVFLARNFLNCFCSRFGYDHITYTPQHLHLEEDIKKFCTQWIEQTGMALNMTDRACTTCDQHILIRYEDYKDKPQALIQLTEKLHLSPPNPKQYERYISDTGLTSVFVKDPIYLELLEPYNRDIKELSEKLGYEWNY